uniref:Uncharacterized protein n=1 Tax=Lepeophtheirus salmonis TaxID=72036 RepID=A0A0K2V056_LEPSM
MSIITPSWGEIST